MSGYAHVRNGSFASVRTDRGDFRSTPVNGHSQNRRACLKGAITGLMRRSRVPPFDHLVGIGELLGQPRFPKPLDQQLHV